MTEKQKIEFVEVEIGQYLDLKRKEQECERYKKEINKLHRIMYCYAYEKGCHKVCKQQGCIIKNGYKYEQTLDELKELVNRLKSRTPLFEIEEIAKDIIIILDIIDKAKEQ